MKISLKIIVILIFKCLFCLQNLNAGEKIKIGLLVPLSGSESNIGKSVLNSVRLAINKIDNKNIEILPKNTKISAGINATSQIKTIIKFKKIQNINKTIFLIPDSDFKEEIENAISNSKIKLKHTHIYETNPTKLTKQIEEITMYEIRKQNVIDEIQRLEDSNEENKEWKINNLKKKDTLGGINFDSVIVSDFEEGLKSVFTSLLYTDVSPQRI